MAADSNPQKEKKNSGINRYAGYYHKVTGCTCSQETFFSLIMFSPAASFLYKRCSLSG